MYWTKDFQCPLKNTEEKEIIMFCTCPSPKGLEDQGYTMFPFTERTLESYGTQSLKEMIFNQYKFLNSTINNLFIYQSSGLTF